MGKVIISFRVFPEDVESNLENIVEKIKIIIEEFGGKYLEHKFTPIAFGLKALDIKFVYPDKEFKEEEFIEKVKNIEGVSDVSIENVTLSSF